MNKTLTMLIVLFFVVLVWSAINPHDYFTWFLEVLPGLLGFLALAFTFRKFKFTNLTYIFVFIHCCILFIGAHYTYAEVPFFDWIRDTFGQSRNNYDKVGHFAQGFIPAMVTRELFIRLNIVKGRSWVAFLTVCVCLAISAVYELIEWGVAELSGESADAFLGTQGYVWDTQSDMLCAMIGAIVMLICFSKLQDSQIKKIAGGF